jgi:hypothetical protein
VSLAFISKTDANTSVTAGLMELGAVDASIVVEITDRFGFSEQRGRRAERCRLKRSLLGTGPGSGLQNK